MKLGLTKKRTSEQNVKSPVFPSKSSSRSSEEATFMGKSRTYERLIPLAFPKEKKPKCDMCEKQATRVCSKCKVTFYCGRDHFNFDDHHIQVCDIMKFVRQKRPFQTSEEERSRMKKLLKIRKEELVDKVAFMGLKSMHKES